MPELDGTEAQARHIERDIERTREEMDGTLTELERRLAPSEIVHTGVETVRERVRSGATNAVEALKRHPLPIAVAAGLLGARFALRPSAAERDRRRAQQDLERALAVFGTAFERAQERAQVGASNLAGSALRTMQRAAAESRVLGRTLRRDAETYPLGALLFLGIAAGMAMFGTRAVRGLR